MPNILDRDRSFTKFKIASEIYIGYAEDYLAVLRDLSHGLEDNPFPGKTLKVGAYCLHDLNRLSQIYEECLSSSMHNEYIRTMIDTLQALEFDSTHITRGGDIKFFPVARVPKYYQLLHSPLNEDVKTFIETVESNITIPAKRFSTRVESDIIEELILAIKNNNLAEVEKGMKMWGLFDFKDPDGRTVLHHAVDQGNINIVRTLLLKQAEIVLLTNKDNTLLNSASFKGYKKIEHLLLQHVDRGEMTAFIDARTISGGTTSLHIAAEKGSLDVVKYLLKYGASYNIEDKNGRTPLDVSNDQKVCELLKSVDKLELECQLDELDVLRWASEHYFGLTKFCLVTLDILSDMNGSEHNIHPWNTFTEGCWYLDTTFRLLAMYQNSAHLSIDNESLRLVNDMLRTLEFGLKRITSGYRCPKYYQLLHSKLRKDVWSFIEMVKVNVEKPIRKFLWRINQRKLIRDIENDNLLGVKDCIKRGVNIDFQDNVGRTALHYAVDKGNIDIFNTLLKEGAKVDVSTLLNLACSKGYTNIVELLLQNVSPDKRRNLIDARTTSGGTSLHIAAQNGFLKLVKYLLKHGANCIIENNDGKIPLELSNDEEVVEFLNSFIQGSLIECKLNQLEKLKTATKNLMNDSLIHISMLRHKLLGGYCKDIVEKCAHYLGTAHRLVELYEEFVPGPIDNQFIRSVNDVLEALEFDPVKNFEERVPKYCKLLQSQLGTDIRLFITMVVNDIEKPVKRFFEQINLNLQQPSSDKLFEAIKNDNLSEVRNCIDKGVIVSCEDTDGITGLHHAVDKGNVEVVRLLLINGAELNEITREGNTPLHLACLKGSREIVSNISPDEKMSVHIATGNGFLEIVNCLVEHGANCIIENKEGKIPVELSNDEKVVEVLNSFVQGGLVECKLDQLEKLKIASKDLMTCYRIHIHVLQRSLVVGTYIPRKTLESGVSCLSKAHELIELYKECVPGPIDNQFIRSVNDVLEALEFVPVKNFEERVPKYLILLRSELGTDIRLFITMVVNDIEKPVKRFFDQINQKFQPTLSDQLLEAIKNGDPSDVEYCIKRGVVVDFEDNDGRRPLYFAVDKGNVDIVDKLLKRGAEVVVSTNNGSTPLHLACFKGYTEIVEVLLENIKPDEKMKFVDARTTSGGTTSVHIAAGNGFLDIVNCLVEHGANCIIENKEGKIPVELSNDQKVVEFLNSFVQGGLVECKLDQLEKLKIASKDLISQIFILRPLLVVGISDEDTVEKCGYYLGKAYRLVELYKEFVPGPIDNKFIRSVNDVLEALEFDPVKNFDERVPKYCKLLRSELGEDVRSFIGIVENDIDKPVKRFYDQINQKYKLFEAIKNNDPSEVEVCLKRGVVVDFKDIEGKTPLYRAVMKGNVNIVNKLLKGGAKVELVDEVNSPLDLASSRGYTEIFQVLLNYVCPDEMINYMDNVISEFSNASK